MTEAPQDPVGWIVPAHGEAPIRAVVAAFYRDISADDVLGPMYPEHDLAGAEQRLADFLVERCGGPPVYTSVRGHPRLRMRHMPFAVDGRARDRWMARMTAALDATPEFPVEARAALEAFLGDVATFLQNR